MSWLISVGSLAKCGVQAPSRNKGVVTVPALHVSSNSRHTPGRWSLVSGFSPASQAKKIWQGVLSELVDD